jgi:acetyl esterase/lipase
MMFAEEKTKRHQLNPMLAPWLVELHAKVAAMKTKGYKATAIGAREALGNMARSMLTDIPAIAWVNDELIYGGEYTVPVRIYHPAPTEARAVIVFYHGGGGMAGSVSVYDPICRKLAHATGQIVVSVEYRLAPENPYPAGVVDAFNVARGVWNALDRRSLPYIQSLSLAGDSAGGALVSTISSRAQFDRSLKIDNQILIYPSLDYTLRLPSVVENGENHFLTRERIIWYFDNYFQHGEDRALVSPLSHQCTLALPRTLIVSAGFDPLRDEALEYVDRLRQAGVPHQHRHYDDMVHGFLFMESLIKQECDSVYQTIADFLPKRCI